MRHTFRITLGFLLVIIGLIGGLIPIFQGWVFGIPGLIILADYFPPVKRVLDWAKSKDISMAVCTNKQEHLAIDLLKKINIYHFNYFINRTFWSWYNYLII